MNFINMKLINWILGLFGLMIVKNFRTKKTTKWGGYKLILFEIVNDSDNVISDFEVLNAIENYNNPNPCLKSRFSSEFDISFLLKSIAFGDNLTCIGVDLISSNENPDIAWQQVIEKIVIKRRNVFGESISFPIYPFTPSNKPTNKNNINFSFPINKSTSFVISRIHPNTTLYIRFYIKQ